MNRRIEAEVFDLVDPSMDIFHRAPANRVRAFDTDILPMLLANFARSLVIDQDGWGILCR